MPAPGSHKTLSRFDLTDRQRQVIELMARGKTNFEIAQELGISLEGAKYHVREVLGRMGADSREDAVGLWRGQRRPWSRIARGLSALSLTGRVIAGSAAALACVATAVGIVVAVRGSPTPRGPAAESSVTAPATPTRTASVTSSAAATAAASPTPPAKGPPVLWKWNTGDPHDVAWFNADATSVAVAVAPLSGGPGFVAYLDASTGYEHWHYAVPSGAFPPTLTSDAVVFGTADGTVWALRRSDSRKLWSVSFPGIPFQTLVVNDTIIVADGDPEVWGPGGLADKTRLAGRVWGIDAATGAVLWKIDTSAFEAFIATSGGTVVISTYDPRDGAKTDTLAVDATTGTQLWRTSTGPATTPPVISGQTVLVATATGPLSALDLRTGHRLWTAQPSSGGTYSFPSLVGDTVLLPSNTHALDVRSVADGSLVRTTEIGECGGRAFVVNGQTFLFWCGSIATIGTNGSRPQPWLVPQGQFQWVEPIAGGILASSYTGEGPVTLLALSVS